MTFFSYAEASERFARTDIPLRLKPLGGTIVHRSLAGVCWGYTSANLLPFYCEGVRIFRRDLESRLQARREELRHDVSVPRAYHILHIRYRITPMKHHVSPLGQCSRQSLSYFAEELLAPELVSGLPPLQFLHATNPQSGGRL